MRDTSADWELRDIFDWAERELRLLDSLAPDASAEANPYIERMRAMLEQVRVEALGARVTSDPRAQEARRLKDLCTWYRRGHEWRWRPGRRG